MTADEGAPPPSRDKVERLAGGRATWALGILAAGLVAIFFLSAEGDEDEMVQPPPPETSLPLAPFGEGAPVADEQGPLPSEGVIGEGTATNGARWMLSIGGPANEVCLTVDALDGSGDQPSMCASVPEGATAEQAYIPLVHRDERLPQFAFGRMPPGVAEVEVALAEGGTVGRVPVARGVGGPYYAVEVPEGQPIAVFGYRADGTAVRYDLPR